MGKDATLRGRKLSTKKGPSGGWTGLKDPLDVVAADKGKEEIPMCTL